MLREISQSQMINTVYMKYPNQYQSVSNMLVERDWGRGRWETIEQVRVFSLGKLQSKR